MVLANIATLVLCNMHQAAVLLFQEPEGGIGWDPISLWKQMGFLAKIVVIILFLMSGWSIGIMIDRALAFSAARSQSRAFAPAVAGALKDGKIEEAIKVADRNKKSHLAKVVAAGLQEFKAHGESTELPGEELEASRRALERSEAIVHAELKRGVAALATIGSTAPFVGLFGTVWGIYHALTAIGIAGQASIDKVAGPVGEALIMTAIGLAVAVPAVLGYNFLVRRNKAVMERVRNFGAQLHTVLLGGTSRLVRAGVAGGEAARPTPLVSNK